VIIDRRLQFGRARRRQRDVFDEFGNGRWRYRHGDRHDVFGFEVRRRSGAFTRHELRSERRALGERHRRQP
jgi:hypothetical protein